MNEIELYNSGIGINNKVIPHRLPFGENGVSSLESASNFILDKTGELATYKSGTSVFSGDCHSGWETDDGFYFINDGDTSSSLMKATVKADATIDTVTIRAGLTLGAKCYYADLDGKTYYANGYVRGVIDVSTTSDWIVNTWDATRTTADMVQMPIGTHLGILSGRMLCAVDDEVFFSEYGLLNLVDNARNRVRFESKVKMVCPVQTGVFVSDEDAIYFLAGRNPKEWTMNKVLNYPATGCAQHLVDPSFFGFETTKLSGLLATVEGQVVGMPDGSCFNLVNKNIKLPTNCGNGAINVVDETTILQS